MPMAYAQDAFVIPENMYNLDSAQVFFNQVAINVPNIITAVILIVVGIVAGKALGKVSQRMVEKLPSNVKNDIKDAGNNYPIWITGTIRWFVYIFFFIAALSVLGFDQLSNALTDLWLWIPNLLAFIMIVIIGVIIANVIGKWLDKEFKDKKIIGSSYAIAVIKIIIYAMVFSIGLTQLGVGEEIIPILITAFSWCLAIGIGASLAIGIGFTLKAILPDAIYSLSKSKKAFLKGNEIKVGKFKGTVEDSDLMHLTLKDAEGKLKVIPLKLISDEIVDIEKHVEEETTPLGDETKTSLGIDSITGTPVRRNLGSNIVVFGEKRTDKDHACKIIINDALSKAKNPMLIVLDSAGNYKDHHGLKTLGFSSTNLDLFSFMNAREASLMINRMMNKGDTASRAKLENAASGIDNIKTLYDNLTDKKLKNAVKEFVDLKYFDMKIPDRIIYKDFEKNGNSHLAFTILMWKIYQSIEPNRNVLLVINGIEMLSKYSGMVYFENMLRMCINTNLQCIVMCDDFSCMQGSIDSFDTKIIMHNESFPPNITDMLELTKDERDRIVNFDNHDALVMTENHNDHVKF